MSTSNRIPLFVSTVATGLYAGIGFFNFMSFLPTLARMPAEHLVPFWRLIDGYMGSRMPVFGPLMLLTLVVTLVLLRWRWRTLTSWLLLAALVVLALDGWVALNENIPVNLSIQDRSATFTTAQIEAFRATMVRAFSIRSALMIASFLLVSGAWLTVAPTRNVRERVPA